MNKNSTQGRFRNFVLKISNSIKIAHISAADLQRAGLCIFVQHYNQAYYKPVSNSLQSYIADIRGKKIQSVYYLNYFNCRQLKLRLEPVSINPF